MTLTTIGFILFLVCAIWFGLVYYAVAILPSKIAHNAKNEQQDHTGIAAEDKQIESSNNLFAKIRQFFYF